MTVLKRAQEIVHYANQCEGLGPETLKSIPVDTIRAAAQIVNGVAFEPLMAKMHWNNPPAVEQGDERAAHRLFCDAGLCGGDSDCFYGADEETQSMWTQAFAAHRLQSTAALEEEIKRLRADLGDFCRSAECAAGCDEGVTQDQAYSEILSFAGSALASSYARARTALDGGEQ